MMLDFWPPTWPSTTPPPYAGTTLDPGPGPFAIGFVIIVVVLLWVVLVLVALRVATWIDRRAQEQIP